MRRGAVMIVSLAGLTACKDHDERRAGPAPAAPVKVALPEIDARWTAPVAADRFLVLAEDGSLRGGAWTGDPRAGVAIAAIDDRLDSALYRAVHGDAYVPDEPPPEEEVEDGGVPTPEQLAWQAERAWQDAHDDERLAILDGDPFDSDDMRFGFGMSGGAPRVPDAAPAPGWELRHGAAGLVVRDPRPSSTLVLAAPTVPASRLITALDELASVDEVFIGVAGRHAPAALAVWFRSNGANAGDDVVPVVALDEGGASVRRTDSKPTGTAIWSGGKIDAAALIAAHQAVSADMEPRWRDAVMVTVDPTITVAQLLDVVTVLLGDGVTAIGLLDFSPPLSTVLVGDPEGTGDVDRAAVRRHVERRRDELAACYAQARIATPSLAGVVTARFRVELDGTVTHVQTFSGPPALVACVEPVLHALRLPRPKGGATYEITSAPIVFRSPP